MDAVQQAWERIERFVTDQQLAALPAGAAPSSIAELEQQLGLPLPVQLRESYLRHDGGPVPVATHGGGLAVVALLPLGSIAAQYEFLLEDSHGGLAGWIPVEAQPDGSFLLVGPEGQVCTVEAGDQEAAEADADSWQEWLNWIANDLTA